MIERTGRMLVSGATGFVGAALLSRLRAEGRSVEGTSRSSAPGLVESPALDATSDWTGLVSGREVVVHAAARVHVMVDKAADPASEYRRINVQGTLNLARQAARAGVRRFLFISSVKVNGESTDGRPPFTEDDRPAPVDPYGVSKLEAEEGLWRLGAETGMEICIVRPPLVYGPGVRANFESMMSWLARGVPLPLGSIRNKRTLVGLDNLVDLLTICIKHPAAAGEVFLAGDDEDLSTTDLLRRMAAALGVPSRLIPVPSTLLEAAAALLGKRSVAQRLCGNLQVDIGKARRLLGWTPPVSVDEGLRRTAEHFLRQRRS